MGIITWIIIVGVIYTILRHILKEPYVVDPLINERVVDSRGYERDGYGQLIHRIVAYHEVYDYPETHSLRFREYDVHHIDRNKRNNSPENLKVLTREEHKKEHNLGKNVP